MVSSPSEGGGTKKQGHGDLLLKHIAAKVNLPGIHKLLATTVRKSFGVLLGGKGLEAGLDRVHGVAAAGQTAGDISDTGEAENFVEARRCSESKACNPRG